MDVSPQRLRRITWALAVGCGVTVANLYYGQPLLPEIGRAFSISTGAVALVVTATQIGYAIGLALLVPLGDLVENRKLASRVLLGTFLALLAAAVSPVYPVFLGVGVLVGVTSVVAQILVPFAAHLAPPEARGRMVGQVMTGLLLGILLARTVSALVAAAWGWRAIYFISAGLTVLLWIVLRTVLPVRAPEPGARYRALLASIGTLVRTEPVLRRRALAQASMFAAFSMFWTAISAELVDEHGLSQTQIGIFALIGAAGAAAAPIGGRLGDRGWSRPGRLVAGVLGSASLVLAGLGAHHVVLLAAGGVLLDFAVQGHQVLSQRDIYGLRADARSRINTVFMTSVFLFGALASALAGVLHGPLGWRGTALVAAAFPLVALVVAVTDHPPRRARSTNRAVPAGGGTTPVTARPILTGPSVARIPVSPGHRDLMRLTTAVTGPATPDAAWERYAVPARWPTWSPQIRSVDCADERIRTGTTGTVHPVFGPAVPFQVLAVDENARTWSWQVRLPFRIELALEHGVVPDGDGTRTTLTIQGWAPVAMAYLPITRPALHRLLRA